MKPWYWEMQEAGWGPHLYLSLEFAPEDGPVLRQLMFDSLPPEFRLEPRTEGQKYSWGEQLLEENTLIWGREGNGQWRFIFLLLTGARLDVEHGWGSRGETDSVWLQGMLYSSRARLQKWSTVAGGDAYSFTYGRSGRDQSSFLTYMRGEVPTPDWGQVEAQLHRVLPQHDPQGKFTLSECVVGDDGDTFKATLLYDVPRTEDGRGWQAYPASAQFGALAKEVGESYGLPYQSSSVSVRSPHDREQFIGGTISFGIASRLKKTSSPSTHTHRNRIFHRLFRRLRGA